MRRYELCYVLGCDGCDERFLLRVVTTGEISVLSAELIRCYHESRFRTFQIPAKTDKHTLNILTKVL